VDEVSDGNERVTSEEETSFADLLPGDGRSAGGSPVPAHAAVTTRQAQPDAATAGQERHPVGIVAPSRTDPLVRLASAVIGGPAGSRLATGTGAIRALSVLILLAVAVLGAGVLEKQHCRDTGWANPDLYWHACYSDIPVLYGSVGLGDSHRPGLTDVVSDGSLGSPLQAAVMWTVSLLVDEDPAARSLRRYFDLSVVILAIALIVLVVVVVKGAGRRPWDAAHVALSPILVTVALVSYDLLAVAFAAGSLLAWSRRLPVLAGVLLGLAVSTRPLTAVFALAVIVLAIRAGAWRAASDFLGAGALTWLGLRVLLFPGVGLLPLALVLTAAVLVAVLVPRIWSVSGVGPSGVTAVLLAGASSWFGFSLWADLGLSHAWRVWQESGSGYGSVWMIPQLLGESQQGRDPWWSISALNASTVTVASLLAMLVVILVAVILALGTARSPRLADLTLFLAAAVLLVGKAVPVQASLLLLPLIAWSGLRWRDHLWWAASEVSYFVGTWLYIAGLGEGRGLPAAFYLLLLLWRLSMIAWVGYQGVRHGLRPRTDPIRSPQDGEPAEDDPLGGVLNDTGDALVVRFG
jgi:hypothetical protein